ncbi:MAG TPA: M1 family aminopeptidase [Thermoanaerobaculia bacterium]|nr:M1 family aminopeptidase [Thermoanaerobaculia bacterium]
MRFGEVFRYEFAHRLRSISTWLYAGFLFLIAFWVIHVAVTGTNPIHVNAPQSLAETTALFCGLFSILVTAGLFSDAAIRDRAAGMDALLFTTRLRPAEYLGGRFLAALAINSILVFAIPIGLALATKMPYLPRDAFGPNHLAAYLQPVLLFLLPNLVLVGAILFTIAALTRQVIPVYLGAIAIFIGYLVAASYWSGITNPMLSALADPLGINALKAMAEYWTASERNTRLIGFPSMLLWNRLLWFAIAAALFGVLQRTFRFTQRNEKVRGSKTVDVPAEGRYSGAVPQLRGVFGSRTRMRQTLAVTRQSLAEAMSGRAFPVAFLAAIGLVLLWGWNMGETIFDTITWPVTHLVAEIVLSERAILIPWLVIALYAGELVWKDRETGAAQIADAAPVRTSVVLLGRFLALVALIALFQLAFMIGGILLQALQGYYDFEPGLYLRILFGWNLVEYVLLAAFAMTVHVLVNHKYVGHVVVLLATVFNSAAEYGIHHLLIYNGGPALKYSEMNGFGPFVTPFVWFKLYWAAWAMLFAVVTMLFWVRGPELGIRQRLATARARLTAQTARMAGLAVVLILAFGGFIFYNTNVLNAYLPPQKAGLPQAEYERRYARYADLPQPVIAGAELRFEIYPEAPAVDMRGSYRLVNQTGVPIRSVHVETPSGRDYEVRSMKFDRASKAELLDPEHGYRIFALERALAPGESMQFSFDVAFRPRGFRHGGWQTKVVRNGSYFDRLLLPFIGYQPGFEVSGDSERKRYGLPPKPSMPGPGDAAARRYWSPFRNGDRMHVETIVGTAADQIAVVPGMLRRSWTENPSTGSGQAPRRYVHYGSRIPETFAASVFSAKYAVAKGKWKDVGLEIFHHPPHRANLDRMMSGMQSSLDYYTSAFGPYPYREFRIVEVPPYSINGRAFPSALALAEQNFITRTGPGVVDLTFFGTAHEVAHQWWGGQVRPAYAKGRGFVSESLANYSAMLVTEKVLGPAEARRVYDFQMNRYLQTRGETGKDVPLLEVDDHPHVSYGKGAVALYTLREHIGAEAVNGALRRFLEKYRGSGPPYPTSLDLYAELRAVTPPSLYPLLTDLFETMTLWDVKTQSAAARRLPDGKYEVTLEVMAQKLRADGIGRETPTPMNDLLEVGIFAPGKDDPIYLARHRIRSGKQTIRIIVPQKPSRAGLDPYRKLIERERGDNLVDVETGAGDRGGV